MLEKSLIDNINIKLFQYSFNTFQYIMSSIVYKFKSFNTLEHPISGMVRCEKLATITTIHFFTNVAFLANLYEKRKKIIK